MTKNKFKLDIAYDYLERFPEARQLKFRYVTIKKMIEEQYPEIANLRIPEELFVLIIKQGMTFNRSILKVQQTNPEVSEKGMEIEKKILQQETQIELGYEPGFNRDIKQSKLL